MITHMLEPIAEAVIIDAFGAWSAAERLTVRSLCAAFGKSKAGQRKRQQMTVAWEKAAQGPS